MTKPTDDLEAVRVVVEALESFSEADDKERILRWAREKLKLPNVAHVPQHVPSFPAQQSPPGAPIPPSAAQQTPRDLRTFVTEKQPKSDVQFAATVAFYHRFEAPPAQRKESINAEDLKEACRLVNRERLKKPLMTLNNARNMGLLDSAGRGVFTINSVGENLVAMTLPAGPTGALRQSKNAKKKPRQRK